MFDKMKLESSDLISSNIDKIAKLFPNCAVEALGRDGKPSLTIDFNALRIALGGELEPLEREAYSFNWVGKQASRQEAYSTIRKTLRPCVEESKDWETTKNVYIEGDNLDVLKLLQESYLGKVKMIYIDPPYNTGNDFIYRDNFSMTREEYDEETGAVDNETGERLFKNANTSGRFHSDWCSMIYPRLLLARNLLSDDGVIFISIDDNEVANLTKICDEIFGRSNFVAQVIWERTFAPINLKKHFSVCHEYVLCYAKNLELLECKGLPRNNTADDRYDNPDNDPRGPWTSGNLTVGPPIESKIYEITVPSGRKVLPVSGYCWRLSKERFQEYVKDNRIWFGTDGNGVPRIKRFLSEVKQSMTPMTLWKHTDVGHSQDATQQLKMLFDGKACFTYPKATGLIERCLQLYSDPTSIILDFFSGSSTTAHAVMQLNAKDGGNRQFIMVQLPEECGEKTEARKAGYRNICEIGKERMRRAGEKIKSETKLDSLDVGFRVFKLSDSNMKDVYYNPNETNQQTLLDLVSNVKEDRTPLDLLFQCLLEWGLPLSNRCEIKIIDERSVYLYGQDEALVAACFDEKLPKSVFEYVAQLKPLRVVFRDASFSSSSDKINALEIFKRFNSESENIIKTI